MKRYLPLLVLCILFVPHHYAHAAVLYADFGTTSCKGTGTLLNNAFCSHRAFTDAARSAGDILFVRRNAATTTGITAATFTSSGNLNNPIVVSADYDNIWGDFATTSETATPVFGSNYVAVSASSTKVSTGTWIYFAGDCYERASPTTVNPCEYAYEVQSASSTGYLFYLPYRGNQSGAGVAVRMMGTDPQIGITTTAAQIFSMSADNYWMFKGLDLRSTNAGGVWSGSASSRDTVFYDSIFQTDGATVQAIGGISIETYLKKVRMFGGTVMFDQATTVGLNVDDSYIDCNNVASSNFLSNDTNFQTLFFVRNTIVTNCTNDLDFTGVRPGIAYFTNVKRKNTYNLLSGTNSENVYFMDDFGVPGLNSQTSNQISSNTLATTTISTSTLRSGGGPTALEVDVPSGTANTGVSTKIFPASYIKLFEYPMYASTASKTYTIYFRSASSSSYVANPLTATASGSSTPELYIECEYYADTTDATRLLKRSNAASAVNFASDTSWYGVSVTCQPSQAGILFLRGWYAKPDESSRTNQFIMDPTPIVS